ncbi:MAG: phage holin family protein [Nitrolancea sp.]
MLYLVANGATMVIIAAILPNQVSYDDYTTVAIFALVLTVLNLSVRPILKLITLPLTCLTFGLFALVVNGVVFYVGARLVSGITITYLGALVGAIIAGLINGALTRGFDTGR